MLGVITVKKILLSVIALLLLLVITACQRAQTKLKLEDITKNISSSFETVANISYKSLKATARISQKSPGECIVTFSSPDSLKDMKLYYTSDKLSVSYKGLSFDFNPQEMPDSAVAGLIVKAFNNAVNSEGVKVKFEENAFVLEGNMNASTFYLKLDSKNSNLLKLVVPSEELEVEFVNFKLV